MSPILLIALIIAVLGVAVFAIHRAFPSVTVKSAEAAVKAEAVKLEADVKADLPDLEADAMAAGQRFLTWLTDTSEEVATIAKARASMTKKNALKAQTAAALTTTTTPPAA